MSNKNTAASGGTNILGLLGVAFVVLKLCGVIDWSWWWVTAPFWGCAAIILLVIVGAFVAGTVLGVLRALKGARKAAKVRS